METDAAPGCAVPRQTTTTVLNLIGKQPRSVAAWLSDNVALFSATVVRAR
jgi:hypothetical protein